MSGASVVPWLAMDEVMAWTMYSIRWRPASTIARQSASKRCTSSVMLSSTMKMARAPWARASRMSSSTRAKAKAWKFRPRISMIEQKLQSKVQPREVSITSTGRPRKV